MLSKAKVKIELLLVTVFIYLFIYLFLGTVPRGTSCNEVSPILSSKPEQRDQTTTPGTTFPTICQRCVGSLTSPLISI